MKNNKIIIIAIIAIVLGLAAIIVPQIMINYNNDKMQSVIEDFDKSVSTVATEPQTGNTKVPDNEDKENQTKNNQNNGNSYIYYDIDFERLYKDMQAYNKMLQTQQRSILVSDSAYKNPCLDLTEYNIFNNCVGYVSAPSIGMEIPIYLGANESSMSMGAAHLSGTSLPIGGENTNTVLSGHTGYIGKILFDNISKLQEGDNVYIKNFWGTLRYKVISKEVIAANDSSKMFIEKDKDLLTLLTCHSYGADRWCVICERVLQ